MNLAVAAVMAAVVFISGIAAASIIPGPAPDLPEEPGIVTASAPAWTGYAAAFGAMLNGSILALIVITLKGIRNDLKGAA